MEYKNINKSIQPMVGSQAMVLDNETGLSASDEGSQNPFQTSRRMARSPKTCTEKKSSSVTSATGTPTCSRRGSTSETGSSSHILPSLELRGNMLFQSQIGQIFNYSLEDQLKNMQLELANIKKENEELKQIVANLQPKSNNKQSYSPANSSDEEELVAKETEYILVKNKNKKRKMARSPEQTYDQPEKSAKNPNQQNKQTVSKQQKPPPIVISDLANYSEMNQTLQKSKLNYKTNMLNNSQLKVNVESETDYRGLTKLLNETNVEWHSYENKQTRPIRVMVRSLHPTCEIQEIKEELQEMGFKIIDVTNKIKKIKRDGKDINIPLPLFMLTFHHTEDIKKIYEIRYLCNMKVTIETLKGNKLIPQCKRCQRYGHTKKFCQRHPACVKCAGNHLTAECSKPRTTAPKCFNCAEEHPASYRGCIIAKELQKRRDNLNKSKNANAGSQLRKFQSRIVNSELSYSQVVKEKQSPPKENNEEQSLMKMMQQMIKRMDAFSERLDRLEAKNSGAISKRIAK